LDFGVSVAPAARTGQAQRKFFSWATVHPAGAGPEVGIRAGLVARALPAVPEVEAEPPPPNWPGYAQNKAYSFVSAFDPSARVKAASVTWRALFQAAHVAGAVAPALEVDEDTLSPALPVLGRGAGEADGLLVDDGAPVWLHESGPAEAFSLGPRSAEQTTISAVATAPHVLALLIADRNGSSEVRELAGGKSRRLFQVASLEPALYPENADALALGPHGALAILRTRSGAEPATADDPALLLDEHGVATVLAPWSRLFLADAPVCKAAPNDYRAVLQTSSAWLDLRDAGASVGDAETGMIALVRVNPDRLCLEAVELAHEAIERGNAAVPTRLAARFVGSGKGAARLGFGAGFELRQPLECALSASR
jgi:hypothetical protein